MSQQAPQDPLIGREIAGHIIQERLAGGGMAVVYRAYDGRRATDVALKLLHAEYCTDERIVRRFEREARIIQRLSHANIVRLFDYGRVDGRLYMTMQLVLGGSLFKRLTATADPVPLQQVSTWLMQIGTALDYAHKFGIIHRDIKPANVLLDRADNAYLTDFGIARIQGGVSLTGMDSAMPGTAHYMSPEQAADKRDLDHRSDLYSLAVLAFVMMLKRYPFDGTSEIDIALSHIREPAPRPSTFRPDLPQAIDEVVIRGLAKDPADRYPSGAAFAADFQRAMLRRPITGPLQSAVPPPTMRGYRPPTPANRSFLEGTEKLPGRKTPERRDAPAPHPAQGWPGHSPSEPTRLEPAHRPPSEPTRLDTPSMPLGHRTNQRAAWLVAGISLLLVAAMVFAVLGAMDRGAHRDGPPMPPPSVRGERPDWPAGTSLEIRTETGLSQQPDARPEAPNALQPGDMVEIALGPLPDGSRREWAIGPTTGDRWWYVSDGGWLPERVLRQP